jgi:hypothetical protein
MLRNNKVEHEVATTEPDDVENKQVGAKRRQTTDERCLVSRRMIAWSAKGQQHDHPEHERRPAQVLA